MNYLKKYKKFLEEADFDINITDPPDLQISKENFEKISVVRKQFRKHIEENHSLKNLIPKIISAYKNN